MCHSSISFEHDLGASHLKRPYPYAILERTIVNDLIVVYSD